MTAEQSDDMRERAATLQKVLDVLDKLRQHVLVTDGDAAVEWVIEQLQGAGE